MEDNAIHQPRYYLLDIDDAVVTVSKREAECLYYLLKGMSSKSIAKKLMISPRTVEIYCQKVKIKVRVRTRLELISAIRNVDDIKAWNF